jgi:hypothetical protein
LTTAKVMSYHYLHAPRAKANGATVSPLTRQIAHRENTQGLLGTTKVECVQSFAPLETSGVCVA